MSIVFSGPAVIVDMNSLSVVELEGEDMQIEPWTVHDREMGPETVYRATIVDETLGELTWQLWEYPANSLNRVQPPEGDFRIVHDFEFDIEFEREEEEASAYVWSKDEQALIAQADEETRTSYMVTWFGQNFCDPAHDTSYNGREGGYQYVHGGPFNAADELYGKFGDAFTDEDIHRAIDEVESDGTMDWAPIIDSDYYIGPDPEELEGLDYTPPSLEEAVQSLEGADDVGWDDVHNRRSRNQLADRIEVIEEVLDRYNAAGIGHNQPPEALGDLPVNSEVLRPMLTELKADLRNNEPDLQGVKESASKLADIWDYVAGRLGIDKAEFQKQFSGELGKRAAQLLLAVGVPALGTAAMTIVYLLGGLVSDLAGWLSSITLPF